MLLYEILVLAVPELLSLLLVVSGGKLAGVAAVLGKGIDFGELDLETEVL